LARPSVDELAYTSPCGSTIARLVFARHRHARASGICAEISQFERFPRPRRVTAYLGLVTKAGSTLGRRLLVEAATTTTARRRRGDAAKTASSPKSVSIQLRA
jgi:transposase